MKNITNTYKLQRFSDDNWITINEFDCLAELVRYIRREYDYRNRRDFNEAYEIVKYQLNRYKELKFLFRNGKWNYKIFLETRR